VWPAAELRLLAFRPKAGVLAAVMERGAQRYFASIFERERPIRSSADSYDRGKALDNWKTSERLTPVTT
jgi:hypothetical protein